MAVTHPTSGLQTKGEWLNRQSHDLCATAKQPILRTKRAIKHLIHSQEAPSLHLCEARMATKYIASITYTAMEPEHTSLP